jgi:hypothetical protein
MKLCYSVLVYVGLSVIRLICTAWYISFLLQMLSSSKMKNFKLVFRNLPLCYSYSYIYSLFDRLMLYRPVVRMMQKNCSHSTFQHLHLSSPDVCLYPLAFAAVRMCVCVCVCHCNSWKSSWLLPVTSLSSTTASTRCHDQDLVVTHGMDGLI